MSKASTNFLKISVLLIGLAVLLICIFLLPWLANYIANMYPEFAHLQYPILIGVYLTVIPFFIALYEAFRLLRFIERGEAFSELAVFSLGRIKSSAIAIFVLYIVGIIYLITQSALHPSIALVGIVIVFATIVIYVFTTVLQEVLKSALDIKNENDLTI
ncbi:DUF2975 domain-containing protein [Bacillus andreraoultii]|uniref:DUF2975 domain-containing protein n=1 Tax=Bacillus andreraoultii TaxID=1499685 RepID=UPI00053B8F81|nr:DUF2975 domain-containing protein [Bacillus andreraoultii]